ncbi:hypothetical protein RB628_33600 [Streptomyces sp. ADMS]|uniref:hypothetical protein n=1 Tax=Streptomyces sp. ADMS TaxID=3071415 RepID=UPI00296FA96A|nr:hypothetical protein [Streptomyces sp. ADMS]MDW4910135.1 hypothetical protein [Streptomyces sp. ADMS]
MIQVAGDSRARGHVIAERVPRIAGGTDGDTDMDSAPPQQSSRSPERLALLPLIGCGGSVPSRAAASSATPGPTTSPPSHGVIYRQLPGSNA